MRIYLKLLDLKSSTKINYDSLGLRPSELLSRMLQRTKLNLVTKNFLKEENPKQLLSKEQNAIKHKIFLKHYI